MKTVYSTIKIFERCDLYYLEFDENQLQGEVTHCVKMTYEMFKNMKLGDNEISYMLRDGYTMTRYGFILDMVGENVEDGAVYNRLVMFKTKFERGSKIDSIIDE